MVITFVFGVILAASAVAIGSIVSREAAQWQRLGLEREKFALARSNATKPVAAAVRIADPDGRIEPTIASAPAPAGQAPAAVQVAVGATPEEEAREVDGIFPDRSLSRKVHAEATVEVHIYRREFQRATRRLMLAGKLATVVQPVVPLPVVECEGMSDEDVLEQAAAHALAVVQAALDERKAITLRPVRRAA